MSVRKRITGGPPKVRCSQVISIQSAALFGLSFLSAVWTSLNKSDQSPCWNPYKCGECALYPQDSLTWHHCRIGPFLMGLRGNQSGWTIRHIYHQGPPEPFLQHRGTVRGRHLSPVDLLPVGRTLCRYLLKTLYPFYFVLLASACLWDLWSSLFRPLAGYGLPPPRGNFVDHIFLVAQCLASILQHVSLLTMAA